jgi:hypothetical protein
MPLSFESKDRSGPEVSAMHRSIILLPILLVVFFIGAVSGQDPLPSPVPQSPAPKPPQEAQAAPCPQLNVQAEAQRQIRDGQPVVFTANIAGGDPKALPTILWNVSAGTISRGQNTRTIVVDSTGAGSTPEREIRADLWVGGYAPECVLQASAVVKVIAPAVKFGEFGVVPDEIVTRNLKALANFLSGSPDDLRLIIYSGRNSERGFAYTWAKRIKAELVGNGVSDQRITVLDGGFREEPLFDFWIVPIGADPPRPSPTIDRREIARPRSPAPKKP